MSSPSSTTSARNAFQPILQHRLHLLIPTVYDALHGMSRRQQKAFHFPGAFVAEHCLEKPV
jgi:hypothetical protein